jgi:CRISPR-associated protein Cmr6
MQNLGHFFYKEYFGSLSFNLNNFEITFNPTQENTKLFESELPTIPANQNSNEHFYFSLVTTYPGLLIGSGYSHEIGGQDNQLKLGFFFDYTTGLPAIPGSSIKGVLRNACAFENGIYVISILKDIAEGTNDRMVSQEIKDLAKTALQNFNYQQFFNLVFDGEIDKVKEEYLSVYKRDIFFDAKPINSDNTFQIFLGNDYITPHKHKKHAELDAFANPQPLQFLKILPQVEFQFYFKLTDNGLNASLKSELFKQILLDQGVGAKTNVGYGQFDLTKKEKELLKKELKERKEKEAAEALQLELEKQMSTPEGRKTINLVDKSRHECTVTNVDRLKYYFKFSWDNEFEISKKIDKVNLKLKIGDKVNVLIGEDYNLEKPLNFTVLNIITPTP